MPSTAERYTLADTGIADAWHSRIDPLIAGGFASKDERYALALKLFHAKKSGRIRDWRGMVAAVSEWVPRKGINQETAIDIAANVLLWWLRADRVCTRCFGTKHPMIPGSNRLDEGRDCLPCKGTGRLFVERCVDPEYAEQARALASRLEALGAVFTAMAPMLRGE